MSRAIIDGMPPAATTRPGMPGRSGQVTRRTVLRRAGSLGVGALAGLLLGGCRVRLQDDAPDLPLLQHKSIPDEALLIAGFREAARLQQLAGRVPGAPALPAELAGIHGAQATVLRAVLTAGGVPDHLVTGTGATSAPPTPAASPPAAATQAPGPAVSAPGPATQTDLAGAEQAAVSPAALAQLAGATPANRVLLTAAAAQRGAAAALLGAVPAWPPGAALPPPEAAALLDATRSVVYAFEVVAAQLVADERAPAIQTLAALRARQRELVAAAGTAMTPEPLGYVLPFPVTSPAAARRLATAVLAQLVARGLDPVSRLAAGSSAVVQVVRWQADAQVMLRQWGGPLHPFPGMAYP